MPLTAMGVPCVRAQIVSSPGTPPETMSTEPDRSASFMAAGLLKSGPHNLDLGNARRLGVLLEQLMLLHQVELQVAHRELAGETDLRHLSSRTGCGRQPYARGNRNCRREPSQSHHVSSWICCHASQATRRA